MAHFCSNLSMTQWKEKCPISSIWSIFDHPKTSFLQLHSIIHICCFLVVIFTRHDVFLNVPTQRKFPLRLSSQLLPFSSKRVQFHSLPYSFVERERELYVQKRSSRFKIHPGWSSTEANFNYALSLGVLYSNWLALKFKIR